MRFVHRSRRSDLESEKRTWRQYHREISSCCHYNTGFFEAAERILCASSSVADHISDDIFCHAVVAAPYRLYVCNDAELCHSDLVFIADRHEVSDGVAHLFHFDTLRLCILDSVQSKTGCAVTHAVHVYRHSCAVGLYKDLCQLIACPLRIAAIAFLHADAPEVLGFVRFIHVDRESGTVNEDFDRIAVENVTDIVCAFAADDIVHLRNRLCRIRHIDCCNTHVQLVALSQILVSRDRVFGRECIHYQRGAVSRAEIFLVVHDAGFVFLDSVVAVRHAVEDKIDRRVFLEDAHRFAVVITPDDSVSGSRSVLGDTGVAKHAAVHQDVMVVVGAEDHRYVAAHLIDICCGRHRLRILHEISGIPAGAPQYCGAAVLCSIFFDDLFVDVHRIFRLGIVCESYVVHVKAEKQLACARCVKVCVSESGEHGLSFEVDAFGAVAFEGHGSFAVACVKQPVA